MTSTYEPKNGRLKLLLRVIDLGISGAMTTWFAACFLVGIFTWLDYCHFRSFPK